MVVIIAEQDSESLSDAFKCQNIEYTVSWTNKNEELRTEVQKLSEIGLPGNKFGPKKHFDRFLQDTMSRLVSSDSSRNKKLINRILKATYDHVAIGHIAYTSSRVFGGYKVPLAASGREFLQATVSFCAGDVLWTYYGLFDTR